MKTNKILLSCIAGAATLFIAAQVAESANPPVINWTPNSKDFSSKATVPGTTQEVTFTAILDWEELKDGATICRLRNPKMTINGTKRVAISPGGVVYIIEFEIENLSGGDHLSIDAVVVDFAAYTAAIATWAPFVTTITQVGGKDVSWTWKDVEQPVITSIDSEGDEIDLKHVSPAVIVRKAWDSTGVTRVFLNTLPVANTTGYAHAWAMNHNVKISP